MVLAWFESALSHSSTQCAVQRRPPDSYGNSGQGETLQAAPKRLTARPMESGRPQRNGTILSPPYTHKKRDGNSLLQISTPLLTHTECSGTKRHLTTKEMKRISNSDKPPPPTHSKKGVYLHAKRVHYNHTTYTKGGNYKWIKQNLTN
jgi:hypothetical protein